MKGIRMPVLVVCALLLSGCYQVKEKFTLNPDKSGKVAVDLTFQPFDLNMTSGQKKSPDEQLKGQISNLLKGSSGVEAWNDVEYNWTQEGKMHFKGTAYCKDVAGFALKNIDLMPVTITKANGRTTLAWIPKEKEEKEEKPAQMTGEELQKKILEKKAEYQQGKGLLTAMLSDLRIEQTFVFSGEVEKATNVKKTGPNEIQFVLEGAKVLKVMDDLTKSDDYWKAAASGNDPLEKSDPEVNAKIFGEKGPVQAVVKESATPLFDYKAEVAAAKPKYDAVMAKLGTSSSIGTTAPPVTAVGSGSFDRVEVAEVQMTRIDSEFEKKSYTLKLRGVLHNAMLSATGGGVEKAITTEGASVLPGEDFDREIHFPQLSEDKTKVTFSVHLLVPPDKTKGLREVSGSLEFVSGDESKAKTVDLGITEFKKGAKGKQYNVEITSVEGGNVQFTIGLPEVNIRSVTFYGEDGKEIKSTSSSRSMMDEETSFCYSFDNLPARGAVKVSVLEGLKKLEVPFAVKNIDLLGGPLQ
jgi:hypothetical protein